MDMKKLVCLFILLGAVACEQLSLAPDTDQVTDEIVFLANNITAEVETKATAVTETDLTTYGFKASCVSGSAGSDSEVWSNVEFAKSGTYWKGGKYWPTSDPTYRFYAVYPKSYSMTAAAAAATISASNAHDIVCAYASSSTYKTTNTLTFNHIFARLGSVTVSAGSGYSISNITINITPKTGGTYNLRTGAWSNQTSGSATNIANSTPGIKKNNLCCQNKDSDNIPGAQVCLAGSKQVEEFAEDVEDAGVGAVVETRVFVVSEASAPVARLAAGLLAGYS